MSELASSTKLRGYVAPLTPERKCRVALVDGETEYPILPRGAGIDLAGMVSNQVEVTCAIQEDEGRQRLLVRAYVVLDSDDDAWLGDE